MAGSTAATPAVLERARRLVEPSLVAAADRLCDELRLLVHYHFGWVEADGSLSTAGSGKGLRPALAVLSAEAVGADASTAIPGAVAVQLVHDFSLVHDDIIDVVFITSGAGHVLVGGEMLDRDGSLGSGIAGGIRQPAVAGDVLHIPAKTPHGYLVPEGGHVTYVLVRVPARVAH